MRAVLPCPDCGLTRESPCRPKEGGDHWEETWRQLLAHIFKGTCNQYPGHVICNMVLGLRMSRNNCVASNFVCMRTQLPCQFLFNIIIFSTEQIGAKKGHWKCNHQSMQSLFNYCLSMLRLNWYHHFCCSLM